MRTLWKQLLLNLLIIFSVLLLFTIFIIGEVKNHDKSLTEKRLLTTARLLQEVLKTPVIKGEDKDIQSFVSDLGEKNGIRITLIDKSGVVIADSEKDPKVMENHAGRPEVAAAISNDLGKSTRYSTTVKKDMFYVAVPLKDETGNIEAVIRTALPLSLLEITFSSIRSKIIYLSLVLTLLALISSFVLSRAFTRSLEKIINASEEIAKGNFNVDIPLTDKKGEVAKLSLALRRMTEKLKELFAQLSLEKSRLEVVLSNMSEGVMVVGRDGKAILMNRALREMFDIKDNSSGKPYWEVLRNKEITELLENVLKKQVTDKKEVTLFSPVEKSYLINALPLTYPEKGAIVMMFDISEFKNLEKIKADFVANVSHELRTPLTAIKGYIETIEEGAYEDAEERNHFLGIVKRHTDRLINIVSDLLVLSQIERKNCPWGEDPKADFEELDLKNIVCTSLEALKSKVEEKNLKVSLDIKEDLPKCTGDGFLLEQMFINLIDNAIKYTPEGGSVGIHISQPDSHFRIEIADTGVGIPKENLPRIFERFYRVDKTRSRKLGGTGLGLSIVKHIVIMHGGKINVQSEEGKGSRFIVELPA